MSDPVSIYSGAQARAKAAAEVARLDRLRRHARLNELVDLVESTLKFLNDEINEMVCDPGPLEPEVLDALDELRRAIAGTP